MKRRSESQARSDLRARLEARREEIEASVLTRVHGISDPIEAADPDYAGGLKAAVREAVDYGLDAIELGEEHAPPVPTTLLMQARFAARVGVPIDTVLRRYFSGYALLGDFLLGVAESAGLRGVELKRLLRIQATLFDRLLEAVSEEYTREATSRWRTTEQQRAERIERLLAGELLDTSGFAYDLNAHHMGLIGVGAGASEAIRDLAAALDCRPLLVSHESGITWAWLGGRRRVDCEQFERLVGELWPPEAPLAAGEPGQGLAGWRLTHQQARAALPVARRRPRPFTRYADAPFLVSTLRDNLLATSLRELYLIPLEQAGDRGKAARETLRAYFRAERNISSAAAALGVNRKTIAGRLSAVETAIGRNLGACGAELEVALGMEQLESTPRGSGPSA